jgi:hypothetical protein
MAGYPEPWTNFLSLTLKADLKTSFMSAGYKGNVTLENVVGLDGAFDANITDLASLADFAGVATEQDLSALGQISASGSVAGTRDNLSVTDIKATQNSRNLTSSFTGNISARRCYSGIR